MSGEILGITRGKFGLRNLGIGVNAMHHYIQIMEFPIILKP